MKGTTVGCSESELPGTDRKRRKKAETGDVGGLKQKLSETEGKVAKLLGDKQKLLRIRA